MTPAASRLLSAASRPLRQPLLLGQVCGSAAGALAVVFAAATMPPDDFTRFALLNLVAVTALGLVRSFFLQPALIEMRQDPAALTPFRYAASGGLLSAVVLAVASVLLGDRAALPVGLLLGAGWLQIIHDWVRFRAMAHDRRWDVVLADGGRLVTVAASPLVLHLGAGPAEFQAFLGLALVLPTILVGLRLPRLRTWTPVRVYRNRAGLQLADFALGQFITTVPLLVLGGLGASQLIGGVRLAQTLLGPLNLVFAASTTHLIADGATRGTHSEPRDLIAQGSRLARVLAGSALAVVLLGVGLLWLTGFGLSGVSHEALLFGLLAVGLASIGSGWGGMHAVILRLLNRHGVVTTGRAALVATVLPAFALGYVWGGVDASLAAGFGTVALLSPLVFGVPAFLVYRRVALRAPREPGPA